MTRKDYELLSSSICASVKNMDSDNLYEVLALVHNLAEDLHTANKAFDTYRFINDCGLGGYCTACGQQETPNCNNANCTNDPVYRFPFGEDLEASLDKLTIRRSSAE